MSLSNLQVEWQDGEAALRTITSFLSKEGMVTRAQVAFMDAKSKPSRTVLPGFGLFDESDGIRAVDWCTPKVARDIDEVTHVYEACVDRPLGDVRRPDLEARKILTNKSGTPYFGGSRTKWDWWVPVVQVMAIASRLTGAPAVTSPGRVVLDLGDRRMEALQRGCWSNLHGRLVTAKFKAEDADLANIATPIKVTFNPLAEALTKLGAPRPILWACNSVIRAIDKGNLAPIRIHSLEPVMPKPRSRKKHVADVVACLAQAREVLDGVTDSNSLLDVYHALVPYAMTKAEFREHLTDPFTKGDRALTPEMRLRIEDLLSTVERSLCSPAQGH